MISLVLQLMVHAADAWLSTLTPGEATQCPTVDRYPTLLLSFIVWCVSCVPLQADLSANGFTGELPAALSQAQNLLYLNVSTNKLTSIQSPKAWDTPSLVTLDLSDNEFTGGHVCVTQERWVMLVHTRMLTSMKKGVASQL